MASNNSILKLQVDDKQYEASLKQAQQGLQALQNALRNSGKSFADVDKQTERYVRELGKMDVTAKTAKGRISEMSSAFVELSRVEKQLTDHERQSPVGKALTESLEQLKNRTIEAKRELSNLSKQLDTQKIPEIKGKDEGINGMIQVFGGNLMARGAEAGISAMKGLAESMKDTVQRGVELSKSAEGIRLAFDRINRPDLLDKLKEATHGTVSELELMKQAVKFKDFNLNLDEMGTLLAFAQQKAKDTGQSVDYMVDSIVTGLGRQSLMILDNLGLSAAQIKEEMKNSGDMTKAVATIIKKQMEDVGDYAETAADRGAKSIADLENATLHLGDAFRSTFGYDGVDEMSNVMETRLIKDFTLLIQSVDTLASSLSSLGIEGNAALGALADTAYGLLTGPLGILLPMTSKYFRTYAANDGTAGSGGHIIEKPVLTKPAKPTKSGRSGSVTELTEEQLNTKLIQQYSREYEKASAERKEWLLQEIKVLQQRNAEIKYYQDLATGKKVRPMGPDTVMGGQGIGLETVDSIGKKLSEPLDVSAIKTPLQSLQEELKKVIELQALAWSPEQFAAYQEQIDKIRGKIDKFTGKMPKEGSETSKDWNEAASAIQSVGSAMSQIEDPAAKVVGTVAQAIATIALTYAKSLEKTFGPWDWIAAAATGAATMMSVISAIHSSTGYALGGEVKGNSYSGDNILMPVDGGAGGYAGLNAGEIVLNKAAQGNLASQLQGKDWGGMHIVGEIQGTKILLVANRTLKSQNKGELVYWRG